MSEADVEAYGLTDPAVLEVANQLTPELFAALAMANRLEDSRFPLKTDADLEVVLLEIGDGEGTFEAPAVCIKRTDAKDRFPNEFLPVVDRFDLIRKVYMAIVIAHDAEGRARLAALRSGADVLVSHPLDLEAL